METATVQESELGTDLVIVRLELLLSARRPQEVAYTVSRRWLGSVLFEQVAAPVDHVGQTEAVPVPGGAEEVFIVFELREDALESLYLLGSVTWGAEDLDDGAKYLDDSDDGSDDLETRHGL